MSAKIEGLQTVLANIRNIVPTETAKMNARLAVAGEIMEESVKNEASFTDHSLKQLADMGHPYSKRYPVDSGPHKDNEVHSQSGKLLANIEKSENLNMVRSTVEVGVDESKVPYVEDLITGTKQRPRNFLGQGFRNALDGIIAATQGR